MKAHDSESYVTANQIMQALDYYEMGDGPKSPGRTQRVIAAVIRAPHDFERIGHAASRAFVVGHDPLDSFNGR